MSKEQVIFIIEDETAIREVVHKYLQLEGFAVLEAESGTQALVMLREHSVDLIILDIMLPGLDGFTIARTIREPSEYSQLATGSSTPIIVLTSRGDENDRLAGFNLGADDYVVKPFSPRELVARVKAVLRRNQSSPQSEGDDSLVFGVLCIDPRRHAVTLGEKALSLTAKEFDLLWFLACHARQVFSREQLLNSVWGYEFYGDESTVTVHIRRLREKIEPDPAKPTYIHTIWGVGYKFEEQ
jgi:DNA-binding response OmpR family regulator